MHRYYTAAEELVWKLNIHAASLDRHIHDLEMAMKDYRMADTKEDKQVALEELQTEVRKHLPHFAK